MSIRVVKRTQIPSHAPWTGTAVAYLLLDRFNAAGWVWGVVGTIYTIVWIVVITVVLKETQVDVLSDRKP